jgi:thiol:disulfide interchange protein DsbD
VTLPSQDFPLGSQDASNFSPFDNGASNLSPFEKEGISEIFPPDVAFVFSAEMERGGLLVARWQIAEGYYLYRNQFKFALKGGGVLGEPQFPPGEIKDDVKYGRVEVYKHQLEIKLPVLDSLDTLTLETSYQGCADGRICYPPIQKTINLAVTSTPALLKDADEFLQVDEAFVFSAEFPSPSYLVLRWKIAEGYYLYRDKLTFSLQGDGELGTPQLPPSILQKDPLFGDVQIYRQPLLEITVPIETEGLQAVTLSVNYQGCAVAGLCYPPTTKVVDLQLGKSSAMSEQDQLANLLANANILYTLIVFFGLGLLLSLTPCVFPMIPILSSIIVGQGQQITIYRAFIMSLVYVLAMALTYAIAGVLTGLAGENLQAAFQNPWVLVSFALVFVVLSLSMFGFYELQIPNALQTKLTHLSNRQQGGTLIGVAIMGILSALIVGPCVAAPLVGALIYIAQTGDAVLGGLALFVMSLGMGIPLIIVGISAGHFLPKAGGWMDSVKAVFGVMLLAVAIWMLERIIAGQVTMLLWATLLIVSAVYMGALDKLSTGMSGWHKLWKGVGLILLVYGILLMIGAASGNVNPLQPLHNLSVSHTSSEAASQATPQFKPIKGVSGLERELAAAQNKRVMLDFSADWCISCKEMEHFTFSDAGVQEALAHFVLLQADVTPNDAQDKALYKRFGIFGPPAIIFFDTNGQEQRNYRVVGFMAADEFLQHLKKVIQQ